MIVSRSNPVKRTSFKGIRALIGTCALLLAPHVQALTIKLTDTGDTPMSPEQFSAFGMAAKYWEGIFRDNITVNVSIEWKDFEEDESHVIASANSIKITLPLFEVRLALITDPSSTEESQRHAQLIDPTSILDTNGTRTSDMVTLTSANAKALGLPGTPGAYDAYISFNNAKKNEFDLDRNDGIDSNKRDFVSVAAHELGHALGFMSSTDILDENPNNTVYPTALDLFRYELSAENHSTSENRIITAGPAEYDDGVIEKIPFSQGQAISDPLCDAESGTCKASHWRDDQGNLMDPTIADGVSINPTAHDVHALDFIGYNLLLISYANSHMPIWSAHATFTDPDCIYCSESIVKYDLPDFPKPPKLKSVKPPFRGANIAMHLGIDTRLKGFQKRSATGYARFESEKKNTTPRTKTPSTGARFGQWEKNAMIEEWMDVIPPRLTGFYFESDSENGSKFSFRAVIPESGLLFNRHMGDHGGFRVSGFVDGFDDRVRGDADANMTLELLMDASGNIHNGLEDLTLSIDASTAENEIKIHDFRAFGMGRPKSSTKR